MRFRLAILLFSLFFYNATIQAQPANNDCFNAITLPISSNWCSAVAQFTNVGATPSNFPAATCFGSTNQDVWFRFTAIGTDLNITINGNQAPAVGGTLNRPQVALYSGTCTNTGGTIAQMQCASGINNIVDLYRGGLIIGQTYLIRVQGNNNNTGTFQICAQNYNAPVQPGSDCNNASILCDKSSFVVQSITGAGQDSDEAAGTCLGGLGGNSESNSTWFKWTCNQSGSFVFSLTPTNASDDLDFVLYELPNGINNCNGRIVLRCMAAGEIQSAFPSPCLGATGLNFSAGDVTEQAGCDQGQDSWLDDVNLLAGRSYALVVNNFSATGNGFRMDFGGTATFVGPTANFSAVAAGNGCASEAWTFTDQSSFAFGNLTHWHWTFGTGASPATANTQGAHQVIYNTPGQKSVVLTLETDRGCIVTKVILINVDSCCQTVNAIHHTGVSNNILCRTSTNGTINITPTTTHLTPYQYTWSNGSNSSSPTNLGIGNYIVTITNGICAVRDTFTINGPPPWLLTDNIIRPTCGGGTDGAIAIQSINGSNGSPYQFNWNNTVFNNNTSYNNLSNGIYGLTIRDNQGCDTVISYNVHELEIELDPVQAVINNPTCYGYTNGSIQIVAQNGLAPYTYYWNHGATNALITNLAQGTYILDTIWDANRCRNWTPFPFTLTAPDSIQILLDTIPVSCAGQPDGQISATVTGGTPGYQYLWSNAQQDSVAINLAAGIYTLTVTDSLLCTQTATTSLVQPPLLEVEYEVQNVLCFGYSNGVIRIIGKGGRPGYLYSLQPSNFSPIDTFLVAKGFYTLYVQDTEGCTASLSAVFVNEPAELIVDAGPDTTIELGEIIQTQVTFSFFDWYDYQWTTNTGDIFCDTCYRTKMQPVANRKTYYLTVTTADGCIAIDSFRVKVEKDRDIFIPNAFSPNGDGNNDYLDVYSTKDVRQIKNYLIFDRWGELVFHTQNIPRNWHNFGWDGKFNGQMMNTNVFLYMIEVEFIDGEVVRYTGDVTLFR